MPPLLSVSHLKVWFPVREGLLRKRTSDIKAVDDLSFDIPEGTTLGLVGESGSGKSTVARTLLKLQPATGGEIRYRGQDILPLSEAEFRPLRKEMQMIFQDPFGSLNPRMTIEEVITEPLRIHFKNLSSTERRDTVEGLLKRVSLPPESMWRYPHEFSGGQRQRIGIARALAVKPSFLICDEPVSALDVSVQAQIINLLRDLQSELGLTYLFIAHDLAVVEHMSDQIIVMNRGRIVERGPAEQVCQNPQDAYTQKLLAAVPSL